MYNPLIRRMKKTAVNTKITAREYGEFQQAFDWFNAHLFDGTLPEALVTLQRKARSRGYFCAERFASRSDQESRVHEIALNPDTFEKRTDTEVLINTRSRDVPPLATGSRQSATRTLP